MTASRRLARRSACASAREPTVPARDRRPLGSERTRQVTRCPGSLELPNSTTSGTTAQPPSRRSATRHSPASAARSATSGGTPRSPGTGSRAAISLRPGQPGEQVLEVDGRRREAEDDVRLVVALDGGDGASQPAAGARRWRSQSASSTERGRMRDERSTRPTYGLPTGWPVPTPVGSDAMSTSTPGTRCRAGSRGRDGAPRDHDDPRSRELGGSRGRALGRSLAATAQARRRLLQIAAGRMHPTQRDRRRARRADGPGRRRSSCANASGSPPRPWPTGSRRTSWCWTWCSPPRTG